MRLSPDQKAALFDRVCPYLPDVQVSLERSTHDLDPGLRLDRVMDASRAVGVALAAIASVKSREEPVKPSLVKVRSWFRGTLLLTHGAGGSSVHLALGRVNLGIGFDVLGRDRVPRLSTSWEIVLASTCGLDVSLAFWRFVPWIHTSVRLTA